MQFLNKEEIKSYKITRGNRIVKILVEKELLRKYKNKKVKPDGEIKEISDFEIPNVKEGNPEIDYRIKLEEIYDLVETPQKINQSLSNSDRKRYRVILEKPKKIPFETERKILEEKLYIKIQPHAPKLGKKLILEVIPLVNFNFIRK